MTDPIHQQLLGHLLDVLDDDEQDWLETRLENDERYRRAVFIVATAAGFVGGHAAGIRAAAGTGRADLPLGGRLRR